MCGVNGETYSSTCAARSARVIVDYQGRCKAVGTGLNHDDKSRCESVTCPEIKPLNCKGIVPPGACCPHCGKYSCTKRLSHVSANFVRNDFGNECHIILALIMADVVRLVSFFGSIGNLFVICHYYTEIVMFCLAAAEVRVLYSLKQLAYNREGFSRYESVTLEQVFQILRRHISTVSIKFTTHQAHRNKL